MCWGGRRSEGPWQRQASPIGARPHRRSIYLDLRQPAVSKSNKRLQRLARFRNRQRFSWRPTTSTNITSNLRRASSEGQCAKRKRPSASRRRLRKAAPSLSRHPQKSQLRGSEPRRNRFGTRRREKENMQRANGQDGAIAQTQSMRMRYALCGASNATSAVTCAQRERHRHGHGERQRQRLGR